MVNMEYRECKGQGVLKMGTLEVPKMGEHVLERIDEHQYLARVTHEVLDVGHKVVGSGCAKDGDVVVSMRP